MARVPGVFALRPPRRRDDRPIAIYAALAEEDGGERLTLWDRILGMATMAFVSAGGWAAIIALIRLLR